MDPAQLPQDTRPKVIDPYELQNMQAEASRQQAQQPQTQPQIKTDGQPSGKKKIYIIAGILGIVILLLGVAVVISRGSTPQEPSTQPQITEQQNPQPATTIGIEQINNSISQDLSSMDDARDFPADQLSDDALKL